MQQRTGKLSVIWSLVNSALPLSSGWFYFSDPTWTNYSARLYRVRSL